VSRPRPDLERATVAPRIGDPPRVPMRLLDAQRAYRDGEITIREAQRRAHGARKPGDGAGSPHGTARRRAEAIRGARERLRRFRRTR
jgi:hypothetical protein